MTCPATPTRSIPLRFISAVVSLFLLTSCGGSSDDTPSLSQDACGRIGLSSRQASLSEIISPRIIAGTQCSSSNSPVVYVDLGSAACSGSMISPRHVLTAAHCFLTPLPFISVSIREARGTPILSRAERVRVHPQARIDTQSGLILDDVAIITLETPLSLPQLPLIVSQPTESGDVIAIYGFGQTLTVPSSEGSPSGGSLFSGEMLVSSVTPSHLFAFFEDQGSNTCFGDSGGPAVATIETAESTMVTGIVGVTSAGRSETCDRGDESNFANTQSDSILDFIRSETTGVRYLSIAVQ